MPTKIYVVNDEGYENENRDKEKFRNTKTYISELLSDKVDDTFSFAGRLEVILSVKHFCPRLLPFLSCGQNSNLCFISFQRHLQREGMIW
jgi:hypothetical protein